MNNIDKTIFFSPLDTNYAQLISLTISDCQLLIDDLQIIFPLTPSLVHLKLISDGFAWKQLLRSELSHLRKLELLLDYELSLNQNNARKC
jgi:hypothetical protein